MGQTIQIKRSSGTDVPNSPLAEGELAYGHFGDSAGKLVIGRPLGSGDTATNDVIGGKFFVDTLNAASSSNGTSTIVKRDANGSFSAGTITASLSGSVTGNVSGNVTGNVTGNSDTATTLETPRNFTVGTTDHEFNGSADVDFTTAINTLISGNANVSEVSNATSAGTANTIVKRNATGGAYFGNGILYAGVVMADLVGHVFGDIKATNGTSVVLDNGTDGTDATFTGSVTGDVTGNVSGSSGSCTGNATTATALASNITINSNAVNGGSSITLDADDISEASSNPSNLYFTDTRAYTAIKAALNDATHTNVSVDFDDDDETIALTGTASVSAGTGVGVDGTEVSIGQAVATTDNVQFAKVGVGTAASDNYELTVDGDLQAGAFRFNNESTTSYFATGFEIGRASSANDVSSNTVVKILADNQAGLMFETRDPLSNSTVVANFGFGVSDTNFILSGNETIFTSDYTNSTLGIGGANVSDKQLKVHGDTEILGNLRIEQSDSNTDQSISFSNSSATAGFKFRNNTANDIFTIEDSSYPVITIPQVGNQTTEKITFHRDVDFSGDVNVTGFLTISGGTTTITSTELAVGDNVITLNDDHSDDTAADEDAGIEINRGLVTDSTDARAKAELVFDASELEWVVKVPSAEDTATQSASTPVLTVANIASKTYVIDGGTF
jgi:hypothetical protein